MASIVGAIKFTLGASLTSPELGGIIYPVAAWMGAATELLTSAVFVTCLWNAAKETRGFSRDTDMMVTKLITFALGQFGFFVSLFFSWIGDRVLDESDLARRDRFFDRNLGNLVRVSGVSFSFEHGGDVSRSIFFLETESAFSSFVIHLLWLLFQR